MSLLNQDDGGGGVFHPLEVEADVLQIAQFEGDWDAVSVETGLFQFVFSRAAGQDDAPSVRLDALINTDYAEPPGPYDILVAGVGSSFLIGGVPISAMAGVMLPRGDALNPLSMIVIVYDVEECDGSGYHVFDSDGNAIAFPRPVLLYHELDHAFEAATGVIPVGGGLSETALAAAEVRAQTEENVLRSALGLPSRDPTNHAGGCGASSVGTLECCIVASVATDSPFSEAVKSLRRTRDAFLRRSEVGHDFFARLHDDYYAFSPEVCRAMAASPALRVQVRDLFVAPLVACLEVMRAYGDAPVGAAALGALVEEKLAAQPVVAGLSVDELGLARALLSGAAVDAGAGEAPSGRLARAVASAAVESPTLWWGIGRPVEMLVDVLLCRAEGASVEAVGARLAGALSAWGAAMPLTDGWTRWDAATRAQQLAVLDECLLRSAEARAVFRERLAARLMEVDDA